MKRSLLIIIIIFCAMQSIAQSFTLQGRVTDENMRPVEFATVSVSQQGKLTLTSLKGEFSMALHSADSVVVKFSMIGYKSKTRVLRHPRGKQTLMISLHSSTQSLDEVHVRGERIQTDQTQELQTKDAQLAPSSSGNAIESMIQQQAGVSTHNELSSQYNVRGGTFDENSVYINNVEIYRPFLIRSGQQEGISIINPYMVDKIGFSTGGYTAKYGDKMSSTLDIIYKKLKPQGKKSIAEGALSASLLGTDAYLGIGTRCISWLNSIRYKSNRNLLGSLDTKGEYKPNFLDYQTYLNYTPNDRWQVDFIGNISDNHYQFIPHDRETTFGTLQDVKNFRVYFDGHEKDRFLTYFGSLGITRHLSKQTSLTFLGSAFYTKEQERYDIQGEYWLDQTETTESLGVGTYFEHARNYLASKVLSGKFALNHRTRQHQVEAAFSYKREDIQENSVEYEMRDSAGYNIPHTGEDLHMIYSLHAKNKLSANRYEAYLQDTYRFTSTGGHTHFTLNYGIRMSQWSYNRETIVSPRISLGIIPAYSENTTIRLATGFYYQAPFFKELRDTSTTKGITNISLNKRIKSQRSIHFIAAYDYRFQVNSQRYRFSAELYYKALSNLVPYSVNNMKITYLGSNEASGHTAGIDFKLYGEFVPGTDSWITLSFMDTQMNLHGEKFPLPTDQRYALNLFFTDYFPGTERWRMSLKLALADGLPFSAPHSEVGRNAFRAPAYRRADIGMSYCIMDNKQHTKRTPFKDIWLGVDCLNLFDINNVNSYYWVTDVGYQQYAVPNYLTGRQLNARLLMEF